MPDSSATMRTASGNATPFNFITSAGASPPRLQGQHLQVFRSGSTSNEGAVFVERAGPEQAAALSLRGRSK